MRVLVIGNTSMIGKRLQQHLLTGHSVLTAGIDGSPDIYLDLATVELASIAGHGPIDAVVHCAASFENDTIEGAIQNEKINSLGALLSARLAAEMGCKHFVHLSSISIYDHPDNGYAGSYGLSKRHGQDNLNLACRILGMDLTSLILSQVYDEYCEARRHQPLFYHIIECARQGKQVTFYGKKNPLRNFLYVGDLTAIVQDVIEKGVYGIYPCVFPVSYTLKDIAVIACRVFGREIEPVFLAEKPDIPSVYIPADRSLFDRVIAPTTSLEKGIELIRDHMESTG